LIDQNELDWKILCVQKDSKIWDLKDFEESNPGRLEAIKIWFETIKTYDGKARNVIESNRRVYSVDETLEIISENSHSYQKLRQGKIKNPGLWLGK